MSEVKTGPEVELVSEVSVEGSVSDVDVVSNLKKLSLGTHQTVCQAISEKADDCFILGKLVIAKKPCSLNGVWKLILREVTPAGSGGDMFAVFAMGKVAKRLKQFTVEANHMLLIHQPQVSKSCLIDFKSLQSHAYELQVICGSSSESKNLPSTGVFIRLIRVKVPDAVETVADGVEIVPGEVSKGPDETEMVPDETEMVPDAMEEVPELHSKNSAQEGSSSFETNVTAEAHADESGIPPKRIRRIKKLLKSDESVYLKVLPKQLERPRRHFYTRLGEITSRCTKANIMGIITSVKKGCPCIEGRDHVVVHLQDEGPSGKNFILNLGCCPSEIPPLHEMYILRAFDVLILFEDDVATGWATKGKLLATVDSDCEKPISLLSVQENCTLSAEDEERIHELRNYAKKLLSPGDSVVQSEDSGSTHVSDDLIQGVPTGDKHVSTRTVESCTQDVSADHIPVNTRDEESCAQSVHTVDIPLNTGDGGIRAIEVDMYDKPVGTSDKKSCAQDETAVSGNGESCVQNVSPVSIRDEESCVKIVSSDDKLVRARLEENCAKDVSIDDRPASAANEDSVKPHFNSSTEGLPEKKTASKAEKDLKKQRVVLQRVLSFLERLPSDLNSLKNESIGRGKCCKCGLVSLPVAGISTRRSNLVMSPRLRESSVRVEGISSEAKRLRRAVLSLLGANIRGSALP